MTDQYYGPRVERSFERIVTFQQVLEICSKFWVMVDGEDIVDDSGVVR